tara:strand:+ start:18 stop:665 length:648 start_codon:yes stop_codon:yes gene_type:complete
MTEIDKRVLTSFFLIILCVIALNNKIILTSLLIFFLFQTFTEFYFILRKLFNVNNKNKLYFTLIALLFYLLSLVIVTWNIFMFEQEDMILVFSLIFLICISTDIGGFIFGKIFKGKKITKISPNKTYSGLIGSYILSLLTTIIFFNEYYELFDLIILTLIISTFSQLGDLTISYLKRKVKIKDTSNILPGHGGFLDRFDGFLLAIPIGYIVISIL